MVCLSEIKILLWNTVTYLFYVGTISDIIWFAVGIPLLAERCFEIRHRLPRLCLFLGILALVLQIGV